MGVAASMPWAERSGRWVLALAERGYDRRGELTAGERDAFAALRGRGGRSRATVA